MESLNVAESTVIYSTEPLWGAAFAALTLGEHVGWNTVFGAVMILTACVLSSQGIDRLGALYTSAQLMAEGFEEFVEDVSANLQPLSERVPPSSRIISLLFKFS
jgi:hypothetical protein